MIFVTIGSQEPFDRLIKAIDIIAPEIANNSIVAQTAKGNYKSKNISTLEFVTPSAFNSYFTQASLIISHAGMGTIISALQLGKPIIVFPRLAKYRETRNDHQVSTAKSFEALNQIHVAYTECQLKNKIVEVLNGDLKPLHRIGKYASPELIDSISSFLSN